MAETQTSLPPMMKLSIRPLTPNLWPALEELFGENGACNGCWCMYWRIGSAYRKTPREKNKLAFRKLVKRGPPPGLIAFHGHLPVGWCQLTPRDALPWLERTWRLKRLDDLPMNIPAMAQSAPRMLLIAREPLKCLVRKRSTTPSSRRPPYWRRSWGVHIRTSRCNRSPVRRIKLLRNPDRECAGRSEVGRAWNGPCPA